MKNVSLIVITDGRQHCIDKTIPSLYQNINYNFYEKIIINDSGDSRYNQYLKSKFPEFNIVSHIDRRGLAGAVQSAWSCISKETDYIFHLEDDFIFNENINIQQMIDILEYNNHLVQLALVRAPVNPPEEEVGGFVFQNLHSYSQKDQFFEHGRLFTLNPCLYPYSTTLIGWPDHGGESEFTSLVHSKNSNLLFGYLGNIYDAPKVTHIGGIRTEGWFL